ncbi:SRPBCC family protein [Rhodococcus sp. NPDC003318]|uniref:SRPBCC family protein n=1 Tax=Rhodococcus sp. NPDC003318 TaxID=3364503 RepID=UPI0036CC1744
MKFTHEFTVDAPIGTAWSELTDLESVAALLPGARLTGRDGDAYLGTVTVKVGPVTGEFAGRAVLRDKDDAAHRAVIEASGKDTRGAGNASATITVALDERDGSTAASVNTDMRIVGKLAQFGSGVIGQVSQKLMGQFTDALAAKLAAPPALAVVSDADEDADAAATAPQSEPGPEPEPINLMSLAGPSLLRRLLPAVAAFISGAAVVFALRRWQRRR